MKDATILYVADDKEFVELLVNILENNDVSIVQTRLGLGDSLFARLKVSLTQANFAVLVLSRAFFERPWPSFELDEVATIDRGYNNEGGRLLPIWHNITQQDISFRSSALARRIGVSSRFGGTEFVAQEIMSEVKVNASNSHRNYIQQYEIKSRTTTQLSEKNLPDLQKVLVEYFTASELEIMSFQLQIDYEDLSGATKSEKAISLIAYMRRRGRLDELIQLVYQQRPNLIA